MSPETYGIKKSQYVDLNHHHFLPNINRLDETLSPTSSHYFPPDVSFESQLPLESHSLSSPFKSNYDNITFLNCSISPHQQMKQNNDFNGTFSNNSNESPFISHHLLRKNLNEIFPEYRSKQIIDNNIEEENQSEEDKNCDDENDDDDIIENDDNNNEDKDEDEDDEDDDITNNNEGTMSPSLSKFNSECDEFNDALDQIDYSNEKHFLDDIFVELSPIYDS